MKRTDIEHTKITPVGVERLRNNLPTDAPNKETVAPAANLIRFLLDAPISPERRSAGGLCRKTLVSYGISLLEAALLHFRMTAIPKCHPGNQTAVNRRYRDRCDDVRGFVR